MAVHFMCGEECWNSESGLCPATGKRVIVARCGDCNEPYEEGHKCLTSTIEETPTKEWYAIPEEELLPLVGRYVTWVEVAPSADVCKCTFHDVVWPGGLTRKMLKSASLECPAHTKEGFLLGFFTWVREHETG